MDAPSSTTMHLARFLFITACFSFGAWSLLTAPPPPPDIEGYNYCVTIHPERYCAIAHLHER